MLGSEYTDHRGVTNIEKAKKYYEEQRAAKSGLLMSDSLHKSGLNKDKQ